MKSLVDYAVAMWTNQILVGLLLVGAVSCFPESRVVNGSATTIEHYPWMVSLRGSTGSHSCGASIIAETWILTAAHCVVGKTPNQISIQYGVTTISSKGENVIAVKNIIVHEGYNPSQSYANDIALLELPGRFVFNGKTIAPVQLPEANFEIDQVEAGAPGVLAGWGLDQTGGSVQTTLQAVDLKIYSDAECNQRHEGATTGDHICGGVDNGGKGQCSGDSGGPLMLGGKQQLGIVSWSKKPCTIAPFPGVYTKVSHFIHWINKYVIF